MASFFAQRFFLAASIICFCALLMGFSGSASGFGSEPYNSGWSLYVDNDLFALNKRDFDYTGGVALKLSGSRAQSALLSLDKGLQVIDEWAGFDRWFAGKDYFSRHNIEYGFTLFTPKDLEVSTPIFDQHPYASLFFVSNSLMVVVPQERVTFQSSLTLGLLGLPLARDVQSTIHRAVGAETPKGWDHQISDGGEPVFRYALMRSKNLLFPRVLHHPLELKFSTEANLGFSTDVGASVSIRWGAIHTPWWSFNPHNAEYISLGTPSMRRLLNERSESYLWAGGGIKYRFYNALLQGQFVDSDVTYQRSELNSRIVELWLGYTQDFSPQWQFSIFLRARNSEIDLPQLRNPVWGGFIISKRY